MPAEEHQLNYIDNRYDLYFLYRSSGYEVALVEETGDLPNRSEPASSARDDQRGGDVAKFFRALGDTRQA